MPELFRLMTILGGKMSDDTPQSEQLHLIITAHEASRVQMMAHLAAMAFGQNAHLHIAQSEAELIHAMAKMQGDVVLVDEGCWSETVAKAASRLAQGRTGIPVIVLTSKTRRPDKTEWPSSLVADYLPQDDITAGALRRAVENARRFHRLESELTQIKSARARQLERIDHELRTPINGILGLSHLLAREALPNTASEYADILCETVCSLQGALERILDQNNLTKITIDNAPHALSGGETATESYTPPRERDREKWTTDRPEKPSILKKRERRTRADFEGMTVLVVDDIVLNRTIIAKTLEPTGATVIEAESGAAALKLMQTRHFDCVLLDIQMPKMDGCEAARHMRQIEAYADHPGIIAFTANGDQHNCEDYLAAGMNGILMKPFTPEDLFSCLTDFAPNPAAGPTPPLQPPNGFPSWGANI